ncbi:hypothetical protein COO60DRAFT_1516275, partial [Scenedesmus sp. NREL 46B-D3]
MVCGLQPICTVGLEVAVFCLCQQLLLIVPAQYPSCLLNETSSWGLCAGFALLATVCDLCAALRIPFLGSRRLQALAWPQLWQRILLSRLAGSRSDAAAARGCEST